jgi:hypothetical protein
VFESIEGFVPHKVLRKNLDPEYYNKEFKRPNQKVRKAYNKRKLGGHYPEQLKQLSKQLLSAKKTAQEAYLKSILSKEGKSWSELYKYVRRYKGNRETIPPIKDCNGRKIIDTVEKTNYFNLNYSTVFSRECNILYIQAENTFDPFTIDIKKLGEGLRRSGKINP